MEILQNEPSTMEKVIANYNLLFTSRKSFPACSVYILPES